MKLISDFMQMPKSYKVIVICGPTATGKSDFAVKLAKQIGAEIISADSRQIYKGMDIGTGKITKSEMKNVPHYLLDIADPKRGSMNVTKFQNLASKVIKEITKRGKIPMLVGGTGFWIDAVAMNQNFPEVKPNLKLRKELSSLTAELLFKRLKKSDKARATNIDPHNRHRLIRAIEIAEAKKSAKGKNKSDKQFTKDKDKDKDKGQIKIESLYIGLDLPQEILDKKISVRLDKRLKQGMIAEVKRLHSNGVSWKKLDSFGLEYRYVCQFLQKKITKEQMREQLYFAIRHYAKRQRTWFKRNKNINWLTPNKNEEALGIAQSFVG